MEVDEGVINNVFLVMFIGFLVGSFDGEVVYVGYVFYGVDEGGNIIGCMEKRWVLLCEDVVEF